MLLATPEVAGFSVSDLICIANSTDVWSGSEYS
jgi:hypothetical protein